MSTLAELQRDFQRHVMHGHERIVDAVESTERVPATTRLAIYSEAYRLRLTDALASTLPRLQQLLGDDEFARIAGEYIDLCPSSFPSIRWFGDLADPLRRQAEDDGVKQDGNDRPREDEVAPGRPEHHQLRPQCRQEAGKYDD